MRRESAGIDVLALERFLLTTPPLADDGRALSWVGPGGFPYDESTVLLARLARCVSPGQASRFVDRIDAQLARTGALGRDGVGYTFDTALAASVTADPAALADRVATWLRDRVACTERSGEARWSTRFGPHLIKAAAEIAPFGHEPLARSVARELIATCFQGGRFRIAAGAAETYVHAHCYAVEGLVTLGGYDAIVDEAVGCLRDLQAEDGSLPAWVGASEDRRPTDVVAQAARLFLAVPGPGRQHAAERALACLGSRQHPSGGLRYTPDSEHVNVWSSAFALQAALQLEGRWPEGRCAFV